MSGSATLPACATAVVVLWAGCGVEDHRPASVPAPTIQPSQTAGRVAIVRTPGRLPVCLYGGSTREPACDHCQQDEDCRSGFCADGKCADLSMYGLGDECDPNFVESPPALYDPPLPGGVLRGPPSIMAPPCGDYFCIDRRCRSCGSDDECGREPASRGATCGGVAARPGYSCGMYHDPTVVFTPVPAQTAVVVPAGGFPHRSVAHGGACVRDGDCRSLFCDRGVCAELYGRGNYGHSCDPAEYQGTPEEIRKRASAEDGCGGYICRQDRCRPCRSDSDCAHGLPAKCVVQEHYSGKVCAGLESSPSQ
jgi:hypothetical protein